MMFLGFEQRSAGELARGGFRTWHEALGTGPVVPTEPWRAAWHPVVEGAEKGPK